MKMKRTYLIFSILMLMLVVPLISAAEFDNVKSYDAIAKEVTIENAFGLPNYLGGYEIAKVKLDTPTHLKVGLGYQKVFEYTIDSYIDYNSFIKELEIYNIKSGRNVRETKEVDLKYKVITQELVDEFETKCKEDVKIGSRTDFEKYGCEYIKVGSHYEDRINWLSLEKLDVKAEKLTISGWTDVHQGDYYEWVPSFAGVKVPEWATWAGNLSTGLIAYYKFDDDSNDSLGTYNLTNDGVTYATGKINNGSDFETSETDNLKADINGLDGLTNYTFTGWFKFETIDPPDAIFWSRNADNYIQFYNKGITIQGGVANSWDTKTIIVLNAGVWYFIAIRIDTINEQITINDTTYTRGSGRTAAGITAPSSAYDYFGTYLDSGDYFDGMIDELAIYGRYLTDAEVTLLYNTGAGCAYGNETCYPTKPEITLNSPVDVYNSTTSIIFNSSVVSPSGITNVSLYLNGTLNETNSSGINNTYYLFTKNLAEGNGNWSFNSCNTHGCTNSATRTFTIDTTVPVLSGIALNTSTVYAIGDKVKLNLTATDLHLSTCWYTYNGANVTVDGCQTGIQNQTDITTVAGQTAITVWANDTFGLNSTPTTVSFAYDLIAPTISIASPTTFYSYLYSNYNHTLTFTATDTNLDKCWYEYNGTNTTLTCATGIAVTNYFNQSIDSYLRVWANDTAGNTNLTNVTWAYSVLENSRTYTSTVYETNTTVFGVNASANSSLTAVSLVYNGTTSALTSHSGGIWNISKQIAPEAVGSQIFRFDYTYGGITITGFNSTQLVKNFFFGQCNATTNLTVLNITFKDENTGSYINSTIDASTWNYSLSSLASYGNTKSFLYTNATHNMNYSFCTDISTIVYSTETIQYSKSEGGTYPQRSQTFTNEQYTSSSLTTKILYLLDSAHGISSSYQVVSVGGSVISGAHIQVTRLIGGITTDIVEGDTDNSGQITFFLSPNYQHTFTVSAAGYTTQTFYITPSLTAYTITMSGTTTPFYYNNTIEGIAYVKWPPSGLITDGMYNFTLDVSSNLTAKIYNCTMNIKYDNGTVFGTATGCNASYPSPGYGGRISVYLNVTNISSLYGEYYIGLSGGGYYYLERDARWKNVPIINSGGGTTLMDVIRDMIDLPEWGDDPATTDFSKIVFFFLFLAITLAILNFFTGYDTAYPGSFIYIVTGLVFLGSIANGVMGHGYFYLANATNHTFFGSFAGIVDNWILFIHFLMLSLIYFFTTNKRYSAG